MCIKCLLMSTHDLFCSNILFSFNYIFINLETMTWWCDSCYPSPTTESTGLSTQIGGHFDMYSFRSTETVQYQIPPPPHYCIRCGLLRGGLLLTGIILVRKKNNWKTADTILPPIKTSIFDLFRPRPSTFGIYFSEENSWNQLNNRKKTCLF